MIRRVRTWAQKLNFGRASELPVSQQVLALDAIPLLMRDWEDAIFYWSRGAQGLYGFSPPEALGHTSHQLLQTQFPEPLDQIQDTLRTCRHWHGELKQIRKDGTGIVVVSQWVLSSDPRTGATTTIQMDADITEHKRVAEAQDRLAAIVESSEDAILSQDLEGIITSWNPAAATLFGFPASDAIGRSMTLVVPPDRRAEETSILERLPAGEHFEPFDTIRLTKDGRRIDVSLTISALRSATGILTGAAEIVRDISDRKMHEKATSMATESAHRGQIEQREQVLWAMLEHIPLGIAIADAPGVTIRLLSRYGRELLPKAEEQLGRGADASRSTLFEFFHQDGTPASAQELPLTRATTKGEVVNGEEWVVARADGSRFPIFCTAAPIRGEGGRIVGGVMGWQDVTQRKQSERALQQAQAELQAQVASVEQTVTVRTTKLHETIAELEASAYSVSHDIRGPIRAIHGYAEMASRSEVGAPNPQTADLLKRIIRSADTVERLIQDILTLNRLALQPIQLELIDVQKLLEQTIHERPELSAPRAEITIQTPLLSLLGHEPSLRQVLINLLGNAVKYVAPGIVPCLRIWTELRCSSPAADPPPAMYREERGANQLVRLWIEDNGIGIPAEAQTRIFELFHRARTRYQYEGTGLGLAIVKRAVERMGGQVGVESEPDRGSSFWIELPHASMPPRASHDESH